MEYKKKYNLTKFDKHPDYTEFKEGLNFVSPNVSWCVEQDELHYFKSIKLTVKFNVTDTSQPTIIVGRTFTSGSEEPTFHTYDCFIGMEIDGVEQDEVVSSYQFETTGEHTVKYTLRDGTYIIEDAFGSFSGNTVFITNGVTTIDNNAFSDCENLTYVNFGNTVQQIGSHAFENCLNLKSVSLPASTENIGEMAFADRTTPQEGVINYLDYVVCLATTPPKLSPLTVKNSGGSFTPGGSGGLGGLRGGIGSLDGEGRDDGNGLINPTGPETYYYRNFGNPGEVTFYVPDASLEQYKHAAGWQYFSTQDNNQAHPSAYNPYININYDADCIKGISEMYFTVTYNVSAEQAANDYSTKLFNSFTTLNRADNVLKIDGVLNDTQNLNGKIVYKNVKIMSEGTHTATFKVSDYRFIPKNIFSNSDVVSISIPNFVSTIQEHAFGEYNAIAALGQTIAIGACTTLQNITIPKNVTKIENGAFKGCSGLNYVVMEATTPPTLGVNVFDNTNDCPIYVPDGSVTAYQAAENWSTYASRIESVANQN